MTARAYPLQWPEGWPRAAYPGQSRFKTTLNSATIQVINEIRRLGGSGLVISSDVPLRNDGLPYGRYAPLKDKGVAVYFTYKKKQMTFACDRWDKVECNLYSIVKTIEALRGIERWGASDMIERAFSGFAQLAAPSCLSIYDVLDIPPDVDVPTLKKAWHKFAKEFHPDVGGNHDDFVKVKGLYEDLLQKIQLH